MITVLITGANRGLGLEFVRQYLSDGVKVIATCRSPHNADELNTLSQNYSNLRVVALELANFAAIDALAQELLGQPIDILINNAGVFGPKPKADGDLRQNFGHIDYDLWASIQRINTMAPVKMSEAFMPQILAGKQRKIVTISSIVGSIAATEGGLYLYRTSKAAVNMAMATLAQDIRFENVIVATMNPGWVKTDMGGSQAPLNVSESVSSVRHQIERLTPENSGAFLDYGGATIPW